MPQRWYPEAIVLALASIILIPAYSSDTPTTPRAASLSVTAAPAIGLSNRSGECNPGTVGVAQNSLIRRGTSCRT
jgi:hypothetical protein